MGYERELEKLIGKVSTHDQQILLKSPTFGPTEPSSWLLIIDTSTFDSPYVEQVAMLDGLYNAFSELSQHPKMYNDLKDPILKLLEDSVALLEAKDESLKTLLVDVDLNASLSTFLKRLTTKKERGLVTTLLRHDKQLLEDLHQLQEDVQLCEPKEWAELCSTFTLASEQLCQLAIEEALTYQELCEVETMREHLIEHEKRVKNR